MNLQTALKLQRLRKEHGFSQEELAEELGVSRQAVSKWERAEASPDTDNLICLAKLYKTSLDELLGIETAEKGLDEKADTKYVENFSSSVDTDKNEKDRDEYDHDEDGNDEDCASTRLGMVINSVTPLVSAIIFLLLGGIWGIWHPAWMVFFSIPLISTLVVAVERKRFCAFAYPVLAAAVYLCLGFLCGLWHPAWIIFTTIPLYYGVFGFIDRNNRSK